jgi:hypothetical protein
MFGNFQMFWSAVEKLHSPDKERRVDTFFSFIQRENVIDAITGERRWIGTLCLVADNYDPRIMDFPAPIADNAILVAADAAKVTKFSQVSTFPGNFVKLILFS